MPRYHFITEDGVINRDRVGTELPNVEQAQHDATKLLAQLLNENPDALWQDGVLKVSATDDRGVILFQLITVAFGAPILAEAVPKSTACASNRG